MTMRTRVRLIGTLLLALALPAASARIITVTTTNNVSPGAGKTSLLQALNQVADGDTVQFNLPGTGPFFITTPAGGYPLITNDNVTLDGYSQPGAVPNTNPILAANNAKLQVVLDSRNGNFTSMNYAPDNSNAGYGDSEFAILGVFRATNVTLRGLCLLGKVPEPGDASNYGISFACDASGSAAGSQVAGCWIGVAPDGKTLAGTAYAITAFRHRDADGQNPVNIDRLMIGVSPTSATPRAEFNVIVQSAIPIVIEGQGTRISGNFIAVLPDGLTDYDVAFDPAYTGNFQFEGAIEIGRSGDNTVIGVDGDGVHDADERNVIGGTVPSAMNGYDHTIEFYGNNPGTNIVIAGNYIGVGVDGQTWFTNGVPAVNAAGNNSQYRLGSDFNGVSDDLEGNVIFNNWPNSLFPASGFAAMPDDLGFFDQLSLGAIISARGNSLANNFPFPVSPTLSYGGTAGAFLANLYASALLDVTQGVVPVLATNTTATRLVGQVPIADTNFWPSTAIDLYAVDPVGLTNGAAAQIPALPNGFVQGRTWLATFVDNSANDRDSNPGGFDFDLTGVDLKGATLITITANYSQGQPGDTNAVVLTSPFAAPANLAGQPAGSLQLTGITMSGGNVVLAWTGGTPPFVVQQKTSLSAAQWQSVVTNPASPATLPTAGAAAFFRLQGSGNP
jgi:hypothetical protein